MEIETKTPDHVHVQHIVHAGCHPVGMLPHCVVVNYVAYDDMATTPDVYKGWRICTLPEK